MLHLRGAARSPSQHACLGADCFHVCRMDLNVPAFVKACKESSLLGMLVRSGADLSRLPDASLCSVAAPVQACLDTR